MASPTVPVSPTVAASSSRFLEIPGELRNYIYEYALTTEHGIDCIFERQPNKKLINPVMYISKTQEAQVRVNRLKLVCRQLHTEVKGLEIVHNPIRFLGSTPNVAGALKGFLRFTKECSTVWLKRLSKVVLIEQIHPATTNSQRRPQIWIADNISTVTTALSVFSAQPQMKVHLKVLYFSFHYLHSPLHFMKDGILLTRAFRGNDESDIAPVPHVITPQIITRAADRMLGKQKSKVAKHHKVLNIHYFPMDDDIDLEDFRQASMDSIREEGLEEEFEEAGYVDEWICLAEKWIKKGI